MVDRLLICAMIEARSAERLATMALALEDTAYLNEWMPAAWNTGQRGAFAESLLSFYRKLAVEEQAHYKVFVDLAKRVAPDKLVEESLERWLSCEASALTATPMTARVH